MQKEYFSSDFENKKDEPMPVAKEYNTGSETSEESEKDNLKGRGVGIDLGTTNSVVSYVDNGKIKVFRVRNSEIVPSAIFFESKEKLIFGRPALRRGWGAPDSLVRLFKRRLKDKSNAYEVRYFKNSNEPEEECLDEQRFLIDTNVFLDEPDILSSFHHNDIIIVSAKVLDELAYRKEQLETEHMAKLALYSIDKNKDRLIFENSASELLPEDFDRRINDNKILSIALKPKLKSPTILTSDKAFQLKCRQLDVKVMSLDDYKKMCEAQAEFKKDGFSLSGEEAATLFLRYLKSEVSKEIGPVSFAVVTVPANFNQVEVEATKNAALTAGFEDVVILKEPTAAAIAYGLDSQVNHKILVYDFGGGTFDVSIIEALDEGKFNVLQTGGDSGLGGEELTHDLIDFLYDEIEDEYDISMRSEEESGLEPETFLQNEIAVYREANMAKEQLSEFEETDITFMLQLGEGGQKSFNRTITRQDFEELIRHRIKQTLDAMDNVLNSANLVVDDIDIVVLAGGTSLMPIIKDRVEKYFGHAPNAEKNTATVISQGAAVVAAMNWGINRDGIQNKITYYEKTVADFGVAVNKFDFDCLIDFATELPVKVMRDYSPMEDNQETLKVSVFRRDRYHPDACRTLDEGVEFVDEILISNLPPIKKTELVIQVTFELTKEDILQINVEVRDSSENLITEAELEVKKSSSS